MERTTFRLEYASHNEDDFSLGVSLSQVPECVGDFAQLVTPVYDRCHFSVLEKLYQDYHVRLVELRHEEDDPLAASQCRQAYFDDVTQRPEQTSGLRCSDHYESRPWVEDAPALRPRPAPRDIEHQVVTLVTPGEILFRVIDNPVCTERTDEVDIPRAADAGHLRSERFGDLHG